MMIRALLPLSLAIVAALPASAQDVGGAWTVGNGRATLAAAGISVPDRAGVVALTKTGEFSDKGKAIDNVAQFQSADGKVFATVYVYRATYADAALAAYATDRAIRARLGEKVVLAQVGAVPFAGQRDGAIRQVFTGGMLSGDAIVSAGAFARVGGWIVKIRATGPADWQAEVTAALDALIAGAAVGKDAIVYPATPLRLAAVCPAPDGPTPRLVADGKNSTANLLAGLFGGATIVATKPDDAEKTAVFPRNGRDAACVRGTMGSGDRAVELIQPVGSGDPATVLVALNDAGTVLAIEKALLGPGYTIKQYAIGRVRLAGTIDRQPTATQLATLLATKDAPELRIRSVTTISARGESQVSINSDALK